MICLCVLSAGSRLNRDVSGDLNPTQTWFRNISDTRRPPFNEAEKYICPDKVHIEKCGDVVFNVGGVEQT